MTQSTGAGIAVLLLGCVPGDAWTQQPWTPCGHGGDRLSIAETVCALNCSSDEPVLQRYLAPFHTGTQEPLLSLARLDDFCDPRVTRTLAIAVAVWNRKIYWKKCHSDDEDTGGCMTPFSDKDTWRWLRTLQEILEVVDLNSAFLFLVQCGDEPSVPQDEEPFPVFHPEGGDGFWNIPWLNPFNLKALHTGYLSGGQPDRKQRVRRKVPWEQKVHKVYWRGTLTAPNEVTKHQASTVPRLRIFQLAKEKPELFDVAVNGVDSHLKSMWGKKTVAQLLKKHAVNFSEFEAVEQVAPRYRYVLNLNGVVSSWRLSYLLGTGSVLLLQNSSTNEALFGLMQPWRHFAPLAADLSNLFDVLEDLERNETRALELAEAAAELFSTRVRREDVYCYALRSLEVSENPEVSLEALEARGFEAAPSLDSLEKAWRGTRPPRLRDLLPFDDARDQRREL